MIKKLFISLFGLLAFTPFVFADSVANYPQSYYFTPGISQVLGNYSYTFDNFGNMFSDNGTVISDSAFYQCGSYGYSVFHNYSWLNGKLYYYSEGNNGTITQGFVNNWCVADFSNPGQCYAGPFDVSWEDVKSNIGNITSVVYGSNAINWGVCSANSPYVLCFGDGTSYYCSNCTNSVNYVVCGLSDSMNFDFNGFNDISSYNWSSSPFSTRVPINVPIEVGNGMSGYTYVSLNTGDYVSYYESVYNFNSDLCYIGTRDLTSNYEDRIPFYQGTGYSVFDFYSKLFNLTNLSISEVGTFVNTWLVNFDTFFLGLNRDSEGNPWFIDYYSGFNDYGVHRGPGLTSPFRNNLSAYYFMSSNIREGAYNVKKTVDGQELALYCYKKGIRTNEGTSYNINDNHNPTYDNRIGVRKRNEENSGYFGSSGEVILGQSRHGTPLDYFTGDGTEDLDFKSFFSNAFNKFAVSYGTLDSSALGIGALPTYIVLFFMALILFRFISH